MSINRNCLTSLSGTYTVISFVSIVARLFISLPKRSQFPFASWSKRVSLYQLAKTGSEINRSFIQWISGTLSLGETNQVVRAAHSLLTRRLGCQERVWPCLHYMLSVLAVCQLYPVTLKVSCVNFAR